MELPSFRKKEPKFDTEGFYKSNDEMEYVEEKNLELKKILEKVDVNVLVDIFMEIYKKAVHYDEKDEYELLAKLRSRLKAAFLKNINVEYSGRMSREAGFHRGGTTKINSNQIGNTSEVGILKIAIHEFVHGFSGRSGMGLTDRDGGLGSSIFEDNRLFISLNEAVTEILADYVLTEYIKRSGDKESYERFDVYFKRNKTYYFEQLATHDVVRNIAKDAGVPSHVVLESLFGHYVRGDFEKAIEELTEEERRHLEPVRGKGVSFSDSLILLLKKVLSK